jgi:hypothetical protein
MERGTILLCDVLTAAKLTGQFRLGSGTMPAVLGKGMHALFSRSDVLPSMIVCCEQTLGAPSCMSGLPVIEYCQSLSLEWMENAR